MIAQLCKIQVRTYLLICESWGSGNARSGLQAYLRNTYLPLHPIGSPEINQASLVRGRIGSRLRDYLVGRSGNLRMRMLPFKPDYPVQDVSEWPPPQPNQTTSSATRTLRGVMQPDYENTAKLVWTEKGVHYTPLVKCALT